MDPAPRRLCGLGHRLPSANVRSLLRTIFETFHDTHLSQVTRWWVTATSQEGRTEMALRPGHVPHLVGASSYTPKSCGFNPQAGQIPNLQVRSLVREHTKDNQSMFFSHINISPSLSPSLPLSLRPTAHILRWGF